MKTKILSLLIALVSIGTILHAESYVVDSGYCGAGEDSTALRWEFSSDGTLSISGNGAMRDFRDSTELPWQHYRIYEIRHIYLSEGITHIGSRAFESMQAVDTITVPQSVKSIGSGAFESNHLQTLVLQEGLERIDEFAFENCNNLWRVILPSTVSSIGEMCFLNCYSIQEFEAINNPHFVSPDGVLFRKDTISLIQYPLGRYVEQYTIPSQCDTIYQGAFHGCQHLQFVTFDHCPHMNGAFYWYDSISFYIPCGMKDIYTRALGMPESRINESVGAVEHAVTFNYEGSGYVDKLNVQALCDGTSMTLSANPYSGYHFVQWSDSVTDNPRNVIVTQDSAFTAIFAPNSYMVSVYSADTTKGKVTYIHGQYEYGTYLHLTATPLEGYAFKGWSDESNAYLCQTDSVTRNYYVRGDTVVYGYFVEADSTVSDSCGANLIWELDCDGLLTFRGSGAMYNYTSSTNPWLPYGRSIRDISFDGEITTITSYAFEYMNLKDSLFIPSSVTEIGDRAFYNNKDLTYVSIPNANIGEYAFNYLRSLQSAVIGNGVYTIGRNAFKSCRKLTTLQLGASLSSIEKEAFRDCDSLRTIICYATTPPVLAKGSSRSFDDNKSRITLYVPAESIESYQNAEEWSEFANILPIEGGGEPMPPCPLASGYCGAGEDSTALRWEMGCNHTLVIEGSGAMEDYMDSLQVPWFDYRYNEIRKIQLSDGITHIGNLAFHNCWAIEELALPQSLQSIGEYAISYCTQLKQIEIPSSVTTIDDRAFYGCETLRTVTNYATTPQAISQYVFDYRVRTYGTLYVPKGSVELYRAAEGWKDFTNIQPIKCIIASGSCGAQGSNLTWEISCDSILTISGTGEMANWTRERETPWYNDNSAAGPRGFLPFHSVVIEEGVTSVGNYAFRNDTSLVSLSLPKSMRKIGEYAFRKAKIKTLTIPENVDTIGQSAFYECAQIASVTCLATTPPTNARGDRFFTNTYNFELHVPCGTAQAYRSSQVWRYWTPTEGIYDYSVGDAQILTMPACLNNSTLRFQAREKAGYFFTQWSDGNQDNPRTVHLEEGTRFAVEAEYEVGMIDIVCAGDSWEDIVINSDTVIGYRHFFVYTNIMPNLSEDYYPICDDLGHLYFSHTEKQFRKAFAEANRYAPKILEFGCKIGENPLNNIAEYWAITSCGDTLRGDIPVTRQSASCVSPSQFTMEGRHFWVGLTLATNASGESEPQTPYLILSAKKACTVTIHNPATGWEITRILQAGQVYKEHDIPLEQWYPSNANSAAGIAAMAGMTMPLGLHVESTEDISVVAMQYMRMSSDATAILPASMLGAEYYTQDYRPFNNTDESYTTITILATEDNTTVEIVPSSTTLDNHPAGVPYTVSLNSGQIYYVLSQNQQSLSGTHVKALLNKSIAVFSGNILTQVPNGVSARDCLYEQAIPTNFWGTEFVVTRSLQKDANRVRITALADETSIAIDGYEMATINAGETFEFEMSVGDLTRRHSKLIETIPLIVQSDAVYLHTSMPVAVYSYDVGNSYTAVETESVDGVGDPSMVWIAPVDMGTTDALFAAPSSSRYEYHHFVNLVALSAYCDQTTLRRNQQYDIPLEWTPVPGNPAYSYSRVALPSCYDCTYSLRNPHGVTAHAYGTEEDGAYAYSLGGTARQVMISGDGYVCLGEQSYFSIPSTIPYDYIEWTFEGGPSMYNASTDVYYQFPDTGAYLVSVTLYSHHDEPLMIYTPISASMMVTVLPRDTFYNEYRMCRGESFIYNGRLYSEAIQDTIAHRCDSIEIFTLQIADCSVETPEEVYVEPESHTVDFTWPIISGAEYYTLIIWANQEQTERLCTLTFNAAGILIRIDFGVPTYAPAYVLNQPQAPKKRHLRKLIVVGTTTLDFTITGLDPDHEYFFEIQAFDKDDEPIDTKSGSFTTTAEVPTGLDHIGSSTTGTEDVRKILMNNHVFILRGNKVYTITGQEIK